MSKKIRLNIGGMTCEGCREKIENKLNSAKGVEEASVSFSKARADIRYDEKKISGEKIVKMIENLGYKVLTSDNAPAVDPLGAVGILMIIAALFYIFQSFGILNYLVPQSLADTGMGYGMLFVTGLITSVHCIAMCGGIGLSQSLPGKQDTNGNSEGTNAFLPSLAYNLGRVCSYTAMGFVFGLAGMIIGGGSSVGFSPVLQGILKIAAGLFMALMGINMLGIFPQLRRISLRMPKAITRVIGKRRRAETLPFAVGLLNGLMPCGPLQSMWIVALATGSPFAGALSMFLFSLGTVPLMLGLGSVVSLLGKKYTDQVTKAGSILVVVLGLAMISQGGALSGLIPADLLLYLVIALALGGIMISLLSQNSRLRYASYATTFVLIFGAFSLWNANGLQINSGQGETKTVNGIQIENGVQIVNSTLTPGKYPDITVIKGIPVRWTIDAPKGSVTGCNKRMFIMDYGIEHNFDKQENVIEFTPDKTGNVTYYCWMGMIEGNIRVIDNPGTGTL